MTTNPAAASGANSARAAPLGTPPQWRDWANLTDGPAGLIAERVLADDVADYLRFRAVCRAWRRCCADPRRYCALDSRFHPRRWLMLKEDDEEAPAAGAPPRRRFLNVYTGQCVATDLPELRGRHRAFGPTAEGLLVLINERTLAVRVLNPFTRQLTMLPSATTLLRRGKRRKKSYARDLAEGLSVTCAGLAGDRALALLFSCGMLAVAKPDDGKWTLVLVDRRHLFVPAASFAGRFYCVLDGAVMAVSIPEDQPPQLEAVAALATPCTRTMMETMHLVDNGSELVLVHRRLSWDSDDPNWKYEYDVYRVDVEAGKTVPVRGLNGRAVFIGRDRAVSVSPAVFPSIIADAVYPSFEFREKTRDEGKMSAYRLADGSKEPSASGYDISSGSWLVARPYTVADFLSLHIIGYQL